MLRIVVALFVTFSLWFAPAWAVQDNQETICDRADILFCDNFEARPYGTLGPLVNPLQGSYFAPATYKNAGWESPYGSPEVVSDQVRDGTHALRYTYPAGANVAGPYSIGYWINNAPEAYVRWYTRWSSNFIWSGISTKHAEITTTDMKGIHLFQHVWEQDADTVTHGITPSSWTSGCGANCADAYHLFRNVGTPLAFQMGRWYCIEHRIKVNSSASTPDGVIEAWIDGVPVLRYTGLILDREPDNNIRRWSTLWLASYWNCTNAEEIAGGLCDPPNAESTHPLMYRWHDNVVAATQPIGCLNSPPPAADTGPPAPPQNLRFSTLWERLLKNFWTLQ